MTCDECEATREEIDGLRRMIADLTHEVTRWEHRYAVLSSATYHPPRMEARIKGISARDAYLYVHQYRARNLRDDKTIAAVGRVEAALREHGETWRHADDRRRRLEREDMERYIQERRERIAKVAP